jgi:bacteriorhodopsin
MKVITKILPHISIVISFLLMTIFVVDKFNSALGLTDNSTTKWLIFALGVVSLVCSIMLIHYQRSEIRRKRNEKRDGQPTQAK